MEEATREEAYFQAVSLFLLLRGLGSGNSYYITISFLFLEGKVELKGGGIDMFPISIESRQPIMGYLQTQISRTHSSYLRWKIEEGKVSYRD